MLLFWGVVVVAVVVVGESVRRFEVTVVALVVLAVVVVFVVFRNLRVVSLKQVERREESNAGNRATDITKS